jgi:hypothetical protein
VVYWARVRVTEAEEVNRFDDRFEVGEENRPSGQEGGSCKTEANGRLAPDRGRWVPVVSLVESEWTTLRRRARLHLWLC